MSTTSQAHSVVTSRSLRKCCVGIEIHLFRCVGEREAAERELNKGDTEGPDIGFDSVGSTLNSLGLSVGSELMLRLTMFAAIKDDSVDVRCIPTHAHICARTDKGISNGVDQLSRNAKVADFDLSNGVGENIRRLDVYGAKKEDEDGRPMEIVRKG